MCIASATTSVGFVENCWSSYRISCRLNMSMRRVFGGVSTDLFPLHSMYQPLRSKGNLVMLFKGCRRFVRTTCRVSIPGASLGNESKAPPRFLRDKNIVPDADPPHMEDINNLYRLFEQSSRLTILTGAGISTECGIPDYRSPNGAYSPGSEKSFGMKQRPDGDIEIDEKFWEEGFHIPVCKKCQGVLKPDVTFFGDNIPKERATQAMEAAKQSDAFLVLGSSLMTMSAFRLVRAAHEAGAMTAIVNIGETRADDLVPLKINARVGEILHRVLDVGSLSVPAL